MKCTAKSKNGKACRAAALTGSTRCLFHSKTNSKKKRYLKK